MKTHENLCYTEPNEHRYQPFGSEDPFRKFLYQDNVTKHRYEVEILKKKSTKRTKTMTAGKKTQSSKNMNIYSEGLDLLQNIKETRNSDLIEEFKEIHSKRRKNHGHQLSSLSHI